MEAGYDETTNKKSKYRPTMEIPLFLLMFGVHLSGNVVTNILLYRTCLHVLHYPDSECVELLYPGERSNETLALEAEVQQYMSMVTMMHSVSGAVVPTVLSLFLGAWSDKYGRKPLIMWPLLGMSLTSYLLIGFTAINSLGPWWYLLTVIPFSFSGGYSALFTGSFTYMADISTQKDRSFRISLMEAGLLFGTVIGTLGSPYLVRVLGNVQLLVVVAAAYSLAYLYVLVWIKESVKKATTGSLKSLFDFSLIRDLVMTCVKKRPNKRRRILFLLTVCCALSVSFTGTLDYLYTRNKLQWSLDIYSIYGVVNTLTAVIGLVLGVTVLQKMLKVTDIWLTMLSYVSSIADNLIKAFAVLSWHMYLATSVSLFRGLSQPILRSMLSKILPVEDLAKVFTLQSVLNVTLPMLAPLVFNPLYSATLNVFPGSIYIVCAAINLTTIVVLGVANYYINKYPSEPEKPIKIGAELQEGPAIAGRVKMEEGVTKL